MTKMRMLRKASGLTMKEVAQRVGRTEGCISLYETGRREPSVKMAKKLAQVLGCVWEELYDDDPDCT